MDNLLVFPFPTVSVMDDVDPGEGLFNSIRLLMKMKNVELERQRVSGQRRNKERPEDKIPPFEFAKDTFNFNNSDAAIYALYLLFSTLNAKEAEVRFRDCWPVYEKKLEGAFRRVALEWIKELIEANPQFFRGIRMETLAGLLVNPGGDRFIFMMRQLCRFVMYTVADRKKGLVTQQVLLPAVPNLDPEVTNRQLHVLRHRTQRLHEQTVKKYKRMVKNECLLAARLKSVEESSRRIQNDDYDNAEQLRSYIINYPNVFGTPTDDELKARESSLVNVTMQSILAHDPYDDFMRDRVYEALKKLAEEIDKPISLVQNVITDFEKIWYILEMDRTKPAILNCDNLMPNWLQSPTTEPSLNSFLDALISSVENILSNEYLNQSVSKELHKEYNAVSLRINYLQMLESKIGAKGDSSHDAGYLEAARSNAAILKIQLDGTDWSLLSRIQENRIGKLLDMTPLPVFDINRVSGRTPGINNFLESSSSSSSGDNTTVIKRRMNIRDKALSRALRRAAYTNCKNLSLNSSVNSLVTPQTAQTAMGHRPPKPGCNLALTPLSSQPSGSKNVSFQQWTGISPPLWSSSVLETSTLPEVGDATPNLSTVYTPSGYNVPPSTTSAKSVPVHISTDVIDSSCLSTSKADIGFDISTQERVSRLLESVAVKSRSSISPINHSSSNGTLNHSNNCVNTNGTNLGSATLDKNGMLITDRQAVADLQNESITDDWECTKGIMETSHIELLLNSDSDD